MAGGWPSLPGVPLPVVALPAGARTRRGPGAARLGQPGPGRLAGDHLDPKGRAWRSRGARPQQTTAVPVARRWDSLGPGAPGRGPRGPPDRRGPPHRPAPGGVRPRHRAAAGGAHRCRPPPTGGPTPGPWPAGHRGRAGQWGTPAAPGEALESDRPHSPGPPPRGRTHAAVGAPGVPPAGGRIDAHGHRKIYRKHFFSASFWAAPAAPPADRGVAGGPCSRGPQDGHATTKRDEPQRCGDTNEGGVSNVDIDGNNVL